MRGIHCVTDSETVRTEPVERCVVKIVAIMANAVTVGIGILPTQLPVPGLP